MPGQAWGTANLGGSLSIGFLSKKLRNAAQPIMRGDQFARPEPGAGKNKGDKVFFNKVQDVVAVAGAGDSSVTDALTEGSPIPITNVTIPQGTLTMNEYGVGIGFTGKLEALSEWQIDNVILQPLKNWAAKKLNTLVLNEFKATYVRYSPTGSDAAPTATYKTDGTDPAAAARDIQAWDVYEIVEYMESTLYTPYWDGENYACLAHSAFIRKLEEDPDWQDAAKFGDPERLFSGEVGRFHNVRFVKNVHGLVGKLGASATYRGSAVFFGEDAVAKAEAIPLEIREKIPADFGRDKALGAYALLGYKIIWDATAAAGEGRIVLIQTA